MELKSLDDHNNLAYNKAWYLSSTPINTCCVLMDDWGLDGNDLMECRRSKPPSLKEQALEQLDSIQGLLDSKGLRSDSIRAALEQS